MPDATLRGDGALCVALGIRTKTGLNAREHYFARAARVKKERAVTATGLLVLERAHPARVALAREPGRPLAVTITRVSPALADDDNLAGAAKAVRDEIAKWLGAGDGPRGRVSWRYEQQKAGRGTFGVLVRIEEAEQ